MIQNILYCVKHGEDSVLAQACANGIVLLLFDDVASEAYGTTPSVNIQPKAT